jgi:hypothetical protein
MYGQFVRGLGARASNEASTAFGNVQPSCVACMHTCMMFSCISMHACMSSCVSVYVSVCMHAFMRSCVCVCACIYVLMHMYVYMLHMLINKNHICIIFLCLHISTCTRVQVSGLWYVL